MSNMMYAIFTVTDSDRERFVRKFPKAKEDRDMVMTYDVTMALPFTTAREAYEAAGEYEVLQKFRVGKRPWAGSMRKPYDPKEEKQGKGGTQSE